MPTTPPADRVSLVIGERDFEAWPNIELRLQVDSIDLVDFDAPFEPERQEFRDTFRPFSYAPLQVAIDDELVLTGTMVGVAPDDDSERSVVNVSGYSKPGPLADNTPPASSLPIEFRGVKLSRIASELATPFGVSVRVEADDGAPFKKVKLDVGQRPWDFLADLARQRAIILGNDVHGALALLQSVEAGSPVARLEKGVPPCYAVRPVFAPQEFHSEITCFAKHRRGRRGSKYTVRNPFLADAVRPLAFTLDDAEAPDAPTAAVGKLGRMLGNAATFTVEVATWRDPDGKLWRPNTTVTLLAPRAMVYRETEFIIRAVTFRKSAAGHSATLELVLPGAFSGQLPTEVPWAG